MFILFDYVFFSKKSHFFSEYHQYQYLILHNIKVKYSLQLFYSEMLEV
jgi:hypothetical protein